jgi:hypothetical protein
MACGGMMQDEMHVLRGGVHTCASAWWCTIDALSRVKASTLRGAGTTACAHQHGTRRTMRKALSPKP